MNLNTLKKRQIHEVSKYHFKALQTITEFTFIRYGQLYLHQHESIKHTDVIQIPNELN